MFKNKVNTLTSTKSPPKRGVFVIVMIDNEFWISTSFVN